jgi:hypothetical protein
MANELFLNLSNIFGYEDYDNYELSQSGIVRNVKTRKVLSGSVSPKGYTVYHLISDTSKSKIALLHRILAQLWIHNPDDHPLVDHIDGDRKNNTITNLRWCTYRNNSQNSKLPNTNKTGELNIYNYQTTSKTGKTYSYWKVTVRGPGYRYEKLFHKTDDTIPQYIIDHRDEISKEIKGDFCPLYRIKCAI